MFKQTKNNNLVSKVHSNNGVIVDKNNDRIEIPDFTHPEILEERPHGRRLSLAVIENNRTSNSITIGALYQGYGTHFVELRVGSPIPQTQTVIVDTGSQVTAFPCMDCGKSRNNDYRSKTDPISDLNHSSGSGSGSGSGSNHIVKRECQQFNHLDNNFNESQSRSFYPVSCDKCSLGFCSKRRKDVQCQIRSSYSEGSSWVAYEAIDRVSIGYINDQSEQLQSISSSHPSTFNSTFSNANKSFQTHVSFHLKFACQTKLSGQFQKQLADGIMGLSRERDSFWYQMHKAGAISQRQFSLCYAPKNQIELIHDEKRNAFDNMTNHVNPNETKKVYAGVISFGGVVKQLFNSPMIFAKLYSSIFYTVKVKSVYMRKSDGAFYNNSIDYKPLDTDLRSSRLIHNQLGYAIVDSGTTQTYLCNIKDKFEKAWKDITGFHYQHDYVDLREDQIAKFPTIIIQLQGDSSNQNLYKNNIHPENVYGLAATLDPESTDDILVAIPPQHYLDYSEKYNKFITRIVLSSSLSGNDNILGSNTLRGHNVLFDIDNDRIGWAESHCNYTNNLNGMSLNFIRHRTNNIAPGGGSKSWETLGLCKLGGCQTIILGGLLIILLLITSIYLYFRYLIVRPTKNFEMINNTSAVMA